MNGRKTYYFRGMGLLTLCALVVLAGIWRFGPEAVTVSSRVGNRELPIYCVKTEKPRAALTFDAAWGNEDTEKILDILEKHNVKATFFLTGGWVENYPEDVKKIYDSGHDLGNHSQNHKNMSQLSVNECREELLSVHEKVQALTGYEMFLFRPPYGDYDNEVITTAQSCGYYSIQWDVDTNDTNEKRTCREKQ